MESFILKDVRQGNLKNISLEIPKGKIILFTGISGSGKSTLAIDVIFQECQRQYLEAMGMAGLRKPDIEYMKHANAAICVTAKDVYKNPRSTVGTMTDIYTDLRMVFEKLSIRECPYCHEHIASSQCKEEVEKQGDDFKVYQYCCACGKRMKKYTRTDFSYNTREGACPTCQGLGEVRSIDKKAVIQEQLSLEEGALDFWKHKYLTYQLENYHRALTMLDIPIPKHLEVDKFTEDQWNLLWYGSKDQKNTYLYPNGVPESISKGRFEGIEPYIWKKLSEKAGDAKQWNQYFHKTTCPDCRGERLCNATRIVTVRNKRLPELAQYSLEELRTWITSLQHDMSKNELQLCDNYILDLQTKLQRLLQVGLGYLTLDRTMMTLSGGEAQRLKLSSVLASQMSGLLYVLDEPTAGLHPKDTKGLIEVLEGLKSLGNTVLVIEHDEEVIRCADYIVDLGIGSGKHGGNIVVQGSLQKVMNCEESRTGQYLQHPAKPKTDIRYGKGYIELQKVTLHNLKAIDVKIPTGVLCGVCGVSGSGKSTLIFDVLAKGYDTSATIKGLVAFDEIINIDQSPPNRMKRSNIATYCDMYTHIRKLFAQLPEAKEKGFTTTHFSFNTKGGRCERCEGMGTIASNLLFFEDVEMPCPLCHGKRFQQMVLDVTWKGYTMDDILHLSIEEAYTLFINEKELSRILGLLMEAGLGYLEIGQSLTTLSQGEAQRCKLSKELLKQKGTQSLYLLDEPTNGLHPYDILNFVKLLHKLVNQGNSVIVVEHNEILLRQCDWLLELGPEGGVYGGKITAQGYLNDFLKDTNAVTKEYL